MINNAIENGITMKGHGMKRLRSLTSQALDVASNLTHIVISLALLTATLFITIYFFYEIYASFNSRSLIKGFLHSLGILLLLWTMAELISTEIQFLKSSHVDLAVFIEVALVVVVREVIMLPVEETAPSWIQVGIWEGAAALLGLTYLFVRIGQRMSRDEYPRRGGKARCGPNEEFGTGGE